MKIAAIILIAGNYLCAISALDGSPHLELGTKITKFNTSFVFECVLPGGYTHELWVLENYSGLSAECLLCFFSNLYFRLEFIEFRKYQYTGGMKTITLSNLDMDIECQIPMRTSVKPLVYCGIKYRPCVYCSNLDIILDNMFYQEFHLGCGFVFPLKTNFKIVFESHLYTDSKWWWWSDGILTSHHIQTWGVERLSFGLRYKFVTF